MRQPIILNCRQGSEEWHRERFGRITASRFRDVMTQPRSKADREAGGLSKTAHDYLLQCADEVRRMRGVLSGEVPWGSLLERGGMSTPAMRWGTAYEPEAREAYEAAYGQRVNQCGFICYQAGSLIGASTDGLIGPAGIVEIKCPYNLGKIEQYREASSVAEHYAQIQGGLWVADRSWCAFAAYDPHLPSTDRLVVHTVLRDDAYIAELAARVLEFEQMLIERIGEM